MTDYVGLFDIAVELRKCNTEVECLGVSSDYIFEKFPAITVIRYLHYFRRYTQYFTITAEEIIKHKVDGFPEPDSAAGILSHTQADFWLRDVRECDDFEDLEDLYNEYGAVCFFGVPLITKDRFVGAVMLGSAVAGALSPPWVKVALDLIACLVAPYLYLKNIRRDLQLGKTILYQVVPDQARGKDRESGRICSVFSNLKDVVSRVLETRNGQGFIPVQQTKKGFRYASDDSDVDPEDILPGVPYVPASPHTAEADSAKGASSPETQTPGPPAVVPGEPNSPRAPDSEGAESDSSSSRDGEGSEGAGPSSSGVHSSFWDEAAGTSRSRAVEQALLDEPQRPGGFGGMGLQPQQEIEHDSPDPSEAFSNLRLGPFSDLGGFEIPLPAAVTCRLPSGLAVEGDVSTGKNRRRPKYPSRRPSRRRPWMAVDPGSEEDYESCSEGEYQGFYSTTELPRYTYTDVEPPADVATPSNGSPQSTANPFLANPWLGARLPSQDTMSSWRNKVDAMLEKLGVDEDLGASVWDDSNTGPPSSQWVSAGVDPSSDSGNAPGPSTSRWAGHEESASGSFSHDRRQSSSTSNQAGNEIGPSSSISLGSVQDRRSNMLGHAQQDAPLGLQHGRASGQSSGRWPDTAARPSTSVGMASLAGPSTVRWSEIEAEPSTGFGHGDQSQTRLLSRTPAEAGLRFGTANVPGMNSSLLDASRPSPSSGETEGSAPFPRIGAGSSTSLESSHPAYGEGRRFNGMAGRFDPQSRGLQRPSWSEIVPLVSGENEAAPRGRLPPRLGATQRAPRVVSQIASPFSEITPLPEPVPDPPARPSALGSFFQWRLSSS